MKFAKMFITQGEARRKTKRGRKKTKRQTLTQQKTMHHQWENSKLDKRIEKLLKPLRVTAQESEEKVAIEIAEKLNEARNHWIFIYTRLSTSTQ